MKCVRDAWDAYRGELLGYARKHLADAQAAHDLVQDVFLRVSRQKNGLCGIENPRAWLFHVARNLLADHYRQGKAELTLDEIPEPVQALSEPAPVEALSQCLPRVLSELSPADRMVLTFCDLEGHSQPALASHLGISLPAAKSRLQRARQRLRAQLVTACQVRFDEHGEVCCFTPRPPC